eukprot:1238695-Amphidinium_carterae.1
MAYVSQPAQQKAGWEAVCAFLDVQAASESLHFNGLSSRANQPFTWWTRSARHSRYTQVSM